MTYLTCSYGSPQAVQQPPTELLHLFGTVCGERVSERPAVYEVATIVEKPSFDYAEQHLRQEARANFCRSEIG